MHYANTFPISGMKFHAGIIEHTKSGLYDVDRDEEVPKVLMDIIVPDIDELIERSK